ncbi:MAG: hypothetical protein BJ554DRAFT_161, partial [Olpidium bornovanus]
PTFPLCPPGNLSRRAFQLPRHQFRRCSRDPRRLQGRLGLPRVSSTCNARRRGRQTAQIIAVVAFYVLDFAINAGGFSSTAGVLPRSSLVQASCRALIIDTAGKRNQEAATAWAGRMIGAGNVVGYLMGYFDLVAALPFLGNSQLKVLCVLASSFLICCVSLTCWTIKEIPLMRPRCVPLSNVFGAVHVLRTSQMRIDCLKTVPSVPAHGNPFIAVTAVIRSFSSVPPTVQRLCNVQFFAWIGWCALPCFQTMRPLVTFRTNTCQMKVPVSVLHVIVVARSSLATPVRGSPVKSTDDIAIRSGSFVLFTFSVVSLAASTLLPFVVAGSHAGGGGARSKGPAKNLGAGDSGLVGGTSSGYGLSKWTHVLETVWQRLRDGLSLTTAYTLSHVVFATSMLLTPLAKSSVANATFLIAACGIPWSVTIWAPFCILGEAVAGRKPIPLRRQRRRAGANGPPEENGQPLLSAAASVAGNPSEKAQPSKGAFGSGSDTDGKNKAAESKSSEAQQELERNKNGGEVSVEPTAREGTSPSWRRASSTTSPYRTSGDSLRPRVTASPCRVVVEDGEDDCFGDEHGPGGFAGGRVQSDDFTEFEDDADDPEEVYEERALEVCDLLGHGGGPSPTTAGDVTDCAPRGDPNELDGGAILGIHNCYCVAPQFLTALLSSMVFAALEPAPSASAVGRAGGNGLASALPSSVANSSAELLAGSVSSQPPAAMESNLSGYDGRAALEETDAIGGRAMEGRGGVHDVGLG